MTHLNVERFYIQVWFWVNENSKQCFIYGLHRGHINNLCCPLFAVSASGYLLRLYAEPVLVGGGGLPSGKSHP